jgi:chromosome segregation protein
MLKLLYPNPSDLLRLWNLAHVLLVTLDFNAKGGEASRVFLKSITLRGFKSFADKTTLDLEPGITVIVGPNGSGKSNIVDALLWVLGTHSAKSLRGGSMADVIYAGAPGRAALGRAAVEITIDNSAGTLPIEFSEVMVARAMFATGETTYSINNVECRALDVQELLSDTGLGRETHTIVGQGQLDAVLNARPEERRILIEEAAGILKHRRRKDRALRKLSQMESHLERLTDLLRELRRTLRPLERQAEVAAKAVELQRALLQVRGERTLRELAGLVRKANADQATRAASQHRLAEISNQLTAERETEAAIEATLAQLAPVTRATTETHFRLANLTERYRGLAERIAERYRGLADAVDEPVAGRDPSQLRAHACAQRAALAELEVEHVAACAALQAAVEARREAERVRRAHEQAAAAEARRRAEARERRLRWEGEVTALRSALAQAASEEGRLASQVSGLKARRTELGADIEAVQAEIQRLDTQAASLAAQLEAAQRLTDRRQAAADAAAKRERELERQRACIEARADTLRAAAQDPGEGAAALLEAAESGQVDGILGRLADHITVNGDAPAISAALGTLEDALLVTARDVAETAVGLVRSLKGSRVVLLAIDPAGVGSGDPGEKDSDAGALNLFEDGAHPLADVLDAEPGVLGALRRALAGVYLVSDFATACRLAEHHPDLVFVSSDGEIAGARGYAGGAASLQAPVIALTAAAEADRQAEAVASELLVAHRQLGDADRALAAARHELDAATAAMQESDGLITAGAERLARLRKELATCERELAQLEGQQADLDREMTERRHALLTLETLDLGDREPEPGGPDLEAERLEDALAEAREQEMGARIALNATEHQSAELRRRIEELEREAADVECQLAERERRRQARLAAIDRCGELAVLVEAALQRAEASQAVADAERNRLEEQRAEAQRELGALRARLRQLDADLAALTAERHREDLANQELHHHLTAVRGRLADDLGLDPDQALADADPATLAADPARDEALAEEEERLSRKLALLGTVNPLAVEEFATLQERHQFLTDQLEDCRASKRDLLQLIEAVDGRIREVFAAAFADVAAHFAQLFPRLFPGGEGRLFLTDPDDLLQTGVEVEARPPGKRVKRLSLLSGGERSLCAIAVLFAIFAARPSPFYVLDEVEAALDDVNLMRFLEAVRRLGVGDPDSPGFAPSQILIVTHQKRTMEIADCLYGVTMQTGGVSKVVSQRVAELTSA